MKVSSVRTINMRGKQKTQNTRGGLRKGKRASWKKAIITLAKDNTIDFFQTV